jgi:cobalamin-dependent methionine synthase I
MISGAAASGKTYYANKLNTYYNLPRVCVKDLTDKAFKMSSVEEPEEGLAADIKAKLDELRDGEVAKIEEERADVDFGEDGAPEIDREKLSIRVPDDFIY